MRPAEAILFDAGLHIKYWGRAIIKAERSGEFTTQQRLQSGSWVTCACGRLDKDIPREDAGEYGDNRPKDSALVTLGELFCTAVANDRFESAAHLLCNIERRAVSVVLETVLKASGMTPPSTNQGVNQHQ